MENLLRSLGERIRKLRAEQGYSQERFAEVCGVHRTYMGHLERGEKNVSLASLAKVADALAITLSELFSGVQQQAPSAVNRASQRTQPKKLARASSAKQTLDRIFEELQLERETLRQTVLTLKEIVMHGKPSRSAKVQGQGRRPKRQ